MDIEILEKQYLGMVPMKDFKWKQENKQDLTFTIQDQKELLQKIIYHELNGSYPPSQTYQIAFLKHVILQAEKHGHDVADELYGVFTHLISLPNGSNGDFCFKSYNLGEIGYVTLKESINYISLGTTGLSTWPASLYFVEWILASQQDFTAKNILELGCGLGFTGISLCRSCEPQKYIFTDCHADVMEVLGINIEINKKNVSTHQEVWHLDWTEEREVKKFVESFAGSLDYLIAADVIYDHELTRVLINTLLMIFRYNPNVKAYITSTIRNPTTYENFLERLTKENFEYKKMDHDSHKEIFYFDRTLSIDIIKIGQLKTCL